LALIQYLGRFLEKFLSSEFCQTHFCEKELGLPMSMEMVMAMTARVGILLPPINVNTKSSNSFIRRVMTN
jgi:hypothetical protein